MEKDWTQETIGWMAFGFTSYFLLYPAFPFYKVIKRQMYFEEAPGSYATVNYINCLCWFFYSELLVSDQIKIINLIGAVANGAFILIYLFFEIRKYFMDTILNALILGSGSYMIYLSLTVMIEDDTVIGKICTGTHCLLFFFPIRLIYRVIKRKNFMLIPFCTAWASMFMSILWILYGIMITEIYLVIPHCLNVILATVQIILFLNYRKKYPIISEKEFNINTSNNSLGIETNEKDDNKKEEPKIKESIEQSELNMKEKPVKILEKENN